MSQLDLFGGGETDEVESASDSPLSSAEVASQINRWPGLYLGTSSWSFPGWRDLEALRDPAFLSDFWRRTALQLPASVKGERHAAE